MEPSIASGTVVYAGEPGAFAEDAVLAAFGDVDRTRRWQLSRRVRGTRGRADQAAGVVPIENVVNGTVRENYDLLLEHDLAIVGEVVVPVRLCLAALPGQRLDEIERVYSHIQALGQAEAFLRTRPWQLLTTYNTAGAGKSIAERGERGAAAVLSPRAAALFGLEILADDIQDIADNRTRFLILAPRGADLPVPPRRRPTADHARPRGPQRAGHAPRGPRGVRAPRPEHEQARVPAEPRTRLGVRLLGRPRRGRHGPRDAGGPRRARRRHDDAARPRQLPARSGRLIRVGPGAGRLACRRLRQRMSHPANNVGLVRRE